MATGNGRLALPVLSRTLVVLAAVAELGLLGRLAMEALRVAALRDSRPGTSQPSTTRGRHARAMPSRIREDLLASKHRPRGIQLLLTMAGNLCLIRPPMSTSLCVSRLHRRTRRRFETARGACSAVSIRCGRRVRRWPARVALSIVLISGLVIEDLVSGVVPHDILNLTDPRALAGLMLVLSGLALRSWAAGFLIKNSQLTTSGPYALVPATRSTWARSRWSPASAC